MYCDIYRISDELFSDWFALETTKKNKDKTEKSMTNLQTKLDQATKTNKVALSTWDAHIATLRGEKASLVAKATEINVQLEEAEVGINGSNAL